MARARRRRTVDARLYRHSPSGETRDYLAWRLGTQCASASLLPQMELSHRWRAHVSVRLRPAKRSCDGASTVAVVPGGLLSPRVFRSSTVSISSIASAHIGLQVIQPRIVPIEIPDSFRFIRGYCSVELKILLDHAGNGEAISRRVQARLHVQRSHFADRLSHFFFIIH